MSAHLYVACTKHGEPGLCNPFAWTTQRHGADGAPVGAHLVLRPYRLRCAHLTQGNRPFMWTVIVITALVAAVAIVIATNFHKPEKSIRFPVEHCHAVGDPQFRLEMDAMLGPDVLEGNRITVLQNGDEIFPAMLAAIRSATRTITFETYIYWSGKIGKEFADALKERSQAG